MSARKESDRSLTPIDQSGLCAYVCFTGSSALRPKERAHAKLGVRASDILHEFSFWGFRLSQRESAIRFCLSTERSVVNYAAMFQSALVALLRNKMRSILTVLGITIGIAAVICVVAIGKAGQARVEEQLKSLGDNFVWIEAGGRAVNGRRTGNHNTKTLIYADAVAIKNQIPLIKSVSPNVDGSFQVVYGNQNWYTGYRGVSPEYFEIKRWYFDQ